MVVGNLDSTANITNGCLMCLPSFNLLKYMVNDKNVT